MIQSWNVQRNIAHCLNIRAKWRKRLEIGRFSTNRGRNRFLLQKCNRFDFAGHVWYDAVNKVSWEDGLMQEKWLPGDAAGQNPRFVQEQVHYAD